MILVLAAGAALAAYLVHIRGSGTGARAQQTGDRRRSSSVRADHRTGRGARADQARGRHELRPEGDQAESQYLAPRAIDANPGTFWRTETYKGQQNDLAGKGGVGLVLDAGQAVTARALKLSTPMPGWSARILSTRMATIPPDITGWKAVSPAFTMTGGTRTVRLDGVPARFYLLWITKPHGTSGSMVRIRLRSRLLAPETEPSLVPVAGAAGVPLERQLDQPVEQRAVGQPLRLEQAGVDRGRA